LLQTARHFVTKNSSYDLKKVFTILALGLALFSAISQTFAAEYPIVFVSRNMVSNGNIFFPQATLIPGMGPYSRFSSPGGKLVILQTNGDIFTLVDSTKSFNGIRLIDVQQPAVSYDGNKIVFAGIESRDSAWRIYEIRTDGTNFKKITFTNRTANLAQLGAAASKFVRYDDIDPVYYPDGRIIFASTRYPTLSFSGYPATNLFITDTLSSYPERVTSERNGAEKPSIDPVGGTVLYSRWWQNIDRPSDLTETGLTRSNELALTSDFGNVWQIASCVTDADELRFFAGDPQTRLTLHNYRGRATTTGMLLSVFTPDRSLTTSSGSPGIRITKKGLSNYKSLVGVDTLSTPYSLAPLSSNIYEGPYATDPIELTSDKIVFSYATSPVNSDYALYTYDLSTNAISPLYDVQGKLDLNPEIVRPRTLPPLRIGLDDFDTSSVPPTIDPETFYKGGLFRFDCLNVYANAPVDVPIDDAPVIHKKAKFQFFLNFQREDPNGLDQPILFREIFVDFDGKIAQGDMPANVPMFEQMTDSNGKVLVNPKGDIAHVMGLNFGANGSGTKCVGCHAGHTQINVATSISEGGFTNLSTSATVSSSSIYNNDQSFKGQKVVDRKANNSSMSVNWIANGSTGEYVDLQWPIPIESRKIKLYNIKENFLTSTDIRVSDCEIYFYHKGVQVKHIKSTGPITEDGTLLNFGNLVIMDRMKVIVKNYSGKVLGKNVAGLAEIEVNAKISFDEPIIEPETPNTYYLNQNYPNPFNPSTKIVFSLQRPEYAKLEVFDLSGRMVALLVSGDITEGEHVVEFRSNPEFSSGVYFYKLTTQSFTQTKKMVLVK
jgi:hypothetical protein